MRARILLVVVGVLVACGPVRPTCPVVPTPPPGPAFLWKVHRDAGPTLWLFGTIHDAGIGLVPPVALAAMDSSARFASELGENEEIDADLRRELTFLKSGAGLDQTLGDDWYDLRDKLRGRIKEADLARARPWFALILLNNEGAPKTVSMDTQLGERADDKDRPVDALESMDVQMRVLDSIVTVEDLRTALRSHHTLSCEYRSLIGTYASGDADAITPMLVIPRSAEPLLYARNRAWLPKLEAYLRDKGAFVAVGLAHMLGEQGLPALLAKAGYTVERIER